MLQNKNLKIKNINFENMDYAAVYVQPNNLRGMINAHYKRPIAKVSCNGKVIYRKLRAKAVDGLDADTVGMDHVSILELSAKEGDVIQIENARFHHRFVSYFVKHPNEDIRAGWYYFALSLLVGMLSLVVSFLSLLK
jgi:hypothetical protein